MNTKKKAGIWMDHANAYITEFSDGNEKSQNIESDFTHQEKVASLSKSEYMMHNKEQHENAAYYKKIGEAIKSYDEVILFGPTEAKAELLNILKADHLFSHIKMETKQTDKMTEAEQYNFVQEYYS